MDKKKLVIIALITIIVASLITNIYILSNKKEQEEFKIEGIDTVETKEILEDASIGNLDIMNISLLTREGISSYKATVTNNTNEKKEINKLYVIFSENDTEQKILALSNVTINANDSAMINITSEIDLSKTTKIKYVIE